MGEQEGEAHPANVLVLAFHGGCEGKYRFLQVREKERKREREREGEGDLVGSHGRWNGPCLETTPGVARPVRPVRLM